jgi:predicted RNA-binding protein
MTSNEIKDLMEKIFEAIGAIANTSVANGGTKLKLKDLAAILTILDIESNEDEYYTSRTDNLIRKAYDYFVGKDQQTADNIKGAFIKKDGTPLI